MAPITKSRAPTKPITRKRQTSRPLDLSSDSESDSADDLIGPQSTTSQLFKPRSLGPSSTSVSSTFFTQLQPTTAAANPFASLGKRTQTQHDAEEEYAQDRPETDIDEDDDIDVSDLASIATRVGKEVDVFAETLDQFHTRLHSGGEARDAALELVTRYRDYAVDEVRRLRQEGKAKGLRQGQYGMRKEGKEVKRWVAEADTWDLVKVVLMARYPSDGEAQEREERLRSLGEVCRYSKPEEVWQGFVLGDDVARERHLVLKWLEQAGGDEEEGKSKEVWVNGWMETRERIKGAKRMRINAEGDFEVRSGKEVLVTQLDPDAVSRQGKALEKGDQIKERDLWKACFWMLRKGQTWEEVCEWISQRNQDWRAASLGIAAAHKLPVGSAGPAKGALWRRMCLIAARTGTSDEFEAAVYGLLGGDLDSVKRVCRTWNDHAFAHYNAQLLAQYDNFVLQFVPLQLPLDLVRKHGVGTDATNNLLQSPKSLVANLAKMPSLSKELHNPFKLLQASLIGGTVGDLCRNVGCAIAETAWKDEPSTVIRPVHRTKMKDGRGSPDEAVISDDPDALRTISHTLIILRALDQSHFSESCSDELDNVIAGYIQLLRVTGKRDLTPMYGSLMAEERCIDSLSQVMADDQDAEDSQMFIKIMNRYGIDAIAVIKGQYIYQLDRVLASSNAAKQPLELLEPTKDDLFPGKRIKVADISTDLTEDEEGLISGLSIFHLVEGHWTVTFSALASACSKLLANGNFPAALVLTSEILFEQLSLGKSKSIVGRPINIANPEHNAMIETSSPTLAPKLHRMQSEAQTYYDVSLLCRAVQALISWSKVSNEFATKLPRPNTTPTKIRKSIEEVQAAVEPLLAGILVTSQDEEEAALFKKIKSLYLPEIILAYVSALCTAGHMVSRDELVIAMEVANAVAGEESSGVAQAFVDSGRMKELVVMFAEVSKTMLKLNEQGRKRERRGNKEERRSSGIWEIYG
ncbi:107-domain-containing protein [Elsinoe ampelina]|uniref:Nuclear pore complex protein n=1 Tax=Elsinoe ampelina TaxID=302913 RepID=A0A6A6GAW5_9PEZI|nr:107-domain-containing protein [Elsinoe ampelina]